MRSQLRRLPALLLALPLLVAPSVALAKPKAAKTESAASESSKKKIGLGAFKGAKSKDVRGKVLDILKESSDYDVTDASDVKPGQDDKTYLEAARSLGVDAIVVGEVTKKFDLKVTVHNGADGASLGEFEIKGGNAKKLQKALDNEFAIAVADPLSQAKAAAPEEPEPEEEKPAEEPKEEPKEEEEPKESDSGSSKPSPLEIMAGLRAYNRNFSYNQPLDEVLPDLAIDPLYTYELPLGPALLLDLKLYPVAFFSGGVAANIGLQVHFEQGFATRSVYAENTPDEVELETSTQEIRAGLRGRIPLDKHEFGVFADFGIHKFRLAGDEDGTVNPAFPLIPDVEYRFIRPGVDATFRFSDFLIGIHAGYRILLSMNELDSVVWFPGAKGAGIDAGLELGYAVLPSLDVIVGGDFLRYAFDFNAIPNDNPVVAGGATDDYISGWVGVRYRLPGSGGE